MAKKTQKQIREDIRIEVHKMYKEKLQEKDRNIRLLEEVKRLSKENFKLRTELEYKTKSSVPTMYSSILQQTMKEMRNFRVEVDL